MEEIKNAIDKLEISRNKPAKRIFKEPNTVTQWCGKDNEQNSIYEEGKNARDPCTNHIPQSPNVPNDVTYRWNSLGLRGPEPDYNAEVRLLAAGGSIGQATGVKEEDGFVARFAEKLNASYINIGDADSITDLIAPLIKFKDFNPTHVLISDTRFFQNYGWAMIDIYKLKQIENLSVYKEIFNDTDVATLIMLDYFLKGLFPNAKLILAYCERRAWRTVVPETFNNIIAVPYPKDMVVDLARDQTHPGPNSHKILSDKIYNSIM